ncbi:NEW3 domain-containing protein [Fervidibacillus albus]|uniref:NEW3 domain-containing protein n=1 Tax=Fervidibacillus albus TaxID=2980026 RepID=A0A9E8LUW0_9BACI|nr:NEW3 domain-containing protein [Fervidibacillus albus]WAA09921.1 NEW3 domain-containing protein [Fervidibacillus albus]
MKKKFRFVLFSLLFIVGFSFQPKLNVYAAGNLTLFTPYTGLSVTPGDTLDYSVDVINSGSSILNVTFQLEDLPEGWDYSITSGGKDIKQLSVRENSEEQLNVEVTVPLDADKADYRFNLVANGEGNNDASLPFLVTVSEQGTFQTELTSEQSNLEGHADSSFSYTVTLKNRTASEQNYALSSSAASGWTVKFQSGSDSITSIALEPNESKDITVDVTPPENVEAGEYEIPIKAATSNTSADLTLEAVITGTYDIELTTPTGNLSTDITAGGEKTVDLVVKNTGTAPLLDVTLKSSTPPNWETEFDTSTIAELNPGEEKTVKATIQASDDAIAGDYVVSFTASAPETSSDATFRVSVETSTLWGIVGIVIIVGVIAGLYYLVKKYGRR